MKKIQPKKIIEYSKDKEINNEEVYQVRELAEELLEYKMQNIDTEIEKHKETLVNELVNYANEKTITKFDRSNNMIKEIEYSPIVINNRYLKPIIDNKAFEPIYSPNRLCLVFDYYNEVIAEINDKIGHFPSSIGSFCKFAGITMMTLRNYKCSPDLDMRTLVEKIYDQIGDDNITMSQLGKASERMTIFKMKVQNELIEKEQPKININLYDKPDMEGIEKRLAEYKDFKNYKG